MTETASEPRLLTAAEIVEASDIATEVVDVPEWGGAVKLQGLTLGDVIALRQEAMVGGKVDAERMGVLLFVESCVSADFTPEQVEALRRKAAGVMARLIKKASDLSGLNEGAVEGAERSFRD